MKKILVILAILTFSFATSVFAQITNSELAGKYDIIKGVNPDGTTYDGSLTIKPDASGGVTIIWDDGSIGLGMIEGNKLYVGMVFEKRSLVMSMTINKDGTIVGKWIQRTEPGIGTESWKKK
jgi:hypothetical protein